MTQMLTKRERKQDGIYGSPEVVTRLSQCAQRQTPPLLFPLFVFLSTSHATAHSAVTRLSLVWRPFLPRPSRRNASLY